MAVFLALGMFSSQDAAGNLVTLYDGGSWLAGLLATLAFFPEKTLGRKGLAVLTAAAAVAFTFSAFLGIPVVTYILGGILGGLITLNSNKWLAYYSTGLSEARYRKLSKWLMTASIFAMMPIFIAVGLAQVFPAVGAVLTPPNLLLGIGVFITLAALSMVLLLRGKPAKAV
jgi:hypothetical protein